MRSQTSNVKGAGSCKICAGNSNLYFIKDRIPYHICKDCGFVFSIQPSNPNLTNNIQDFEPAYLQYLGPQKHDAKNHEWILDKIGKHKDPAGCRILDLGCGSGKLVRYTRKQGYDAYGLEPSKALFDEFLEDEDHFFNTRTEFQFDIIIISDVIEHVEDPQGFMRSVREMLMPGGLIFISTPDTSSLPARALKKRWHYYNKYHLSLFSRSNLQKLALQHGLEFKGGGYVSRYQSLDYMFRYLQNFVMGKKNADGQFGRGVSLRVNLYDNIYGIFVLK